MGTRRLELAARSEEPVPVAVEPNLYRKGIWHTGPLQLAFPLDGEDLVGLVRTTGEPLTTFDMDTSAWLCDWFQETQPALEQPLLFTQYRICRDLFGDRDPGGRERRLVAESFKRLRAARFEMEVWDPSDGELGLAGAGIDAGIVSEHGWAKDYERARRVAAPDEIARIAASRRGSSTYWVFLAPWLTRHLRAGHLEYVDWRMTRALSGLAKRLYYLLYAEPDFHRTRGRVETKRIALTPALLFSLGLVDEHKARARAQLRRACEQLVGAGAVAAIDFEREGQGSWAMLVSRPRLSAPSHRELAA